ncbi:hypothetical protein K440DRAFT_659725 [Wilcoxina mikolae CBS 423.85]|nr:hypothetical protein K440DRAFT_659725 [Wilcoxina mikolae CBS 423.85]
MEHADKMRPIELQSPEDLRHLINKLQSVASEKIQKQLPVSDDPLRKRVDELVSEVPFPPLFPPRYLTGIKYVLNTFRLALPNITINALEPLPLESYLQPVEEYEPYDQRLHESVTALHQKIEKRTLQIAAMRREKPELLRQAFEEELAAEERRGENLRRGWEEELRKEREEEVVVREVERWEEVEMVRNRALTGLEELKTGLPRVVGRLERAGRAAGYVLEKREREKERVGRG